MANLCKWWDDLTTKIKTTPEYQTESKRIEAQIKRYQPWCWDDMIQPLLDRKNIIHNLDTQRGDGVDIVCDCQDMSREIKDETYDVVLFFNTLEHLFYTDKAILEIYRVLKPKGLCFSSCPAEDYPYHEDPVDTMLRLSTLVEWRDHFKETAWTIDVFKIVKSYRSQFNRLDVVSLIRANKI